MPSICKLPRDSGVTEVAPLEAPLFIADLHLSWRKIAVAKRFFHFLKNEALHYKELFILGDLFEFWVGDDAGFIAFPVSRALREYRDAGHCIYLMPGNRDTLLGEDFARASGATLIQSSIAVTFEDKRILLAHGDEWCTLDTDYQKFREMLRSEKFQKEAFSMNFLSRILWALRARKESIRQKREKTLEEMDVVKASFREAAAKKNCRYIIHGHTHRPASYEAEDLMRIVLPDWRENGDRAPLWGYAEIPPSSNPRLVLF